MRTIRIYKTSDDTAWVSPTRYFSAILSGEPIQAVVHADLPLDETTKVVTEALAEARVVIECMLWALLWASFRGLLYTTSFVLTLLYPPIASRIHEGVHGVLLIFLLAAGGVSIFNIIKIIINRIRFTRRHRKFLV